MGRQAIRRVVRKARAYGRKLRRKAGVRANQIGTRAMNTVRNIRRKTKGAIDSVGAQIKKRPGVIATGTIGAVVGGGAGVYAYRRRQRRRSMRR